MKASRLIYSLGRVCYRWFSFGLALNNEGQRRFRVAYVESGKRSGKSSLAAGMGILYCLVADNEARAEVYATTTKKDQAMILFRDAVAMVD